MLQRIRSDYHRFDRALTAVAMLDREDATDRRVTTPLLQAIDADNDLYQVTNELAERTTNQTDALIAANRSAYRSSRNLFIGVGALSVALAVDARPRPLLVADRPDPAHGGAARRDRGRRLLRAGRRPNRDELGSLGRERKPDERRASPALRRARDSEPSQERVPREHVARAANAAKRDHRLLAGAPAASVRRRQREAGGSTSTTSARRAITSCR